jgi:hypothetical protein
LTRAERVLDEQLRNLLSMRISQLDLIYLVLIAALFLFSIWMIRSFDRL